MIYKKVKKLKFSIHFFLIWGRKRTLKKVFYFLDYKMKNLLKII